MIFESGTWINGCNYWASNAGCHMWNEWDPATVEKDFSKMADMGLKCIRVFPLWQDFQPITMLCGQGGVPKEIAWKNDSPLPADGKTLDPVMLERFRFLCDCAAKYEVELIVALLTGWMSGRLFVPPALEKCNLFTDPTALYYECKFIEEFITEMKDHHAIVMWEPGNECNCLSKAADRAEARMWLKMISNAIRAADNSRPVGAGMHGLRPAAKGAASTVVPWIISDVGEDYDFLTTHPYPAFTEYASTDPLGSPKSLTHAAAESRYFADLSRRPCFAEEVGSLAPNNGSEKQIACYIRGVLPELYRQDCRGLLWWCAFDQKHLTRPPYRWCAIERELGLFRLDGSLKPVAEELQKFQCAVEKLPFKKLPPMQRDAVVILTDDANSWGAAWGAYLLAQRAGFEVEFCRENDLLPDKKLYIVPCLAGWDGISQDLCKNLEMRAADGAAVLYTYKDAMLSPFGEELGIASSGRSDSAKKITVEIAGKTLIFNTVTQLRLTENGCEVLLRDTENNIVCTRKAVGKGHMAFFALPLELEVIARSNGVEDGYEMIYRLFSDAFTSCYPVRSRDTLCGVSFHQENADSQLAFLFNRSHETKMNMFELSSDWQSETPLPEKLDGYAFSVLKLYKK